MAKDHKPGAFALFAMSSALLCGGWLMKSFPILIFGALAPLFAIADNTRNDRRFWNFSELILVALLIGLMAARVLDVRLLVPAIGQAILLTLAFLAYSISNRRLGNWIGKFTIISFWLTVEYFFLRLPYRDRAIYLGDALILRADWLKWTQYTGYLGTSLWILIANFFLYQALFKEGKINWFFLIMTLLMITGPIGFSYWLHGKSVSRTDMIALYSHRTLLEENYIRIGEVIPGIAAGISVLIVITAGVVNKSEHVK
jgi:hypothetical protein